jgi:predicted MFS family arabinose efflux permease
MSRHRVLTGLSLAGLCATLVGNGIGRFAFIALVPALIQGGWFSQADALYLGVATLVGYVVGAPMADALARRWSSAALLRGAMLVCALSFFACGIEGAPLVWYYFWRTVVGVAGALLMVIAAPVVVPRHSERLRGRVSGVVFSGIGLGAVFAGASIPLLTMHGLTGAWLGLGAICLLLTLLAWGHWPSEGPAKPTAAATAAPPEPGSGIRLTVGLILAAHGLNAVGYLAHTMFWVDYVVRELGLSLAEGGWYWAFFGLGAAVGPMLTGTLADWLGLKRCLIAAFVIKAFAALLPVLDSSAPALLASSLLMGIFTPGIVALVSAYALDRVGPLHHRRAWGLATTSFAVAQAVGGAAMAYAATQLGSYEPLFGVSAAALVGSVVCILLIPHRLAAPPSASAMAAAGWSGTPRTPRP